MSASTVHPRQSSSMTATGQGCAVLRTASKRALAHVLLPSAPEATCGGSSLLLTTPPIIRSATLLSLRKTELLKTIAVTLPLPFEPFSVGFGAPFVALPLFVGPLSVTPSRLFERCAVSANLSALLSCLGAVLPCAVCRGDAGSAAGDWTTRAAQNALTSMQL
eukprot:7376215-Prymnesium_polylepis.1